MEFDRLRLRGVCRRLIGVLVRYLVCYYVGGRGVLDFRFLFIKVFGCGVFFIYCRVCINLVLVGRFGFVVFFVSM